MKARQFVLFLIVAAFAVPLFKKLWKASQSTHSGLPEVDRSQVVTYVEEALHDHKGEETPLVQAFESALEMESRHGESSLT